MSVEMTPEGCQLQRFTVPSPSMERDIRVAIVLPPAYEANPEKRFPVLYTLHGRGAPYATYSQMSPLKKALRDKPMIVACFDGDEAGMYIDSTTKPDSQFTTFFFDEFIPYMNEHYRTSGVQGVEGFSMGGYGAFHYMLTKPDAFASVSGMSSAFWKAGPNGRMLTELIGPYEGNEEAYRQLDTFARLEQYVTDGVKLPPMMMHCGTEDFLLEANRDFERFLVEQNKRIRDRLEPQVASIEDQRERGKKLDALMAENRLEFLYMESPGAHNWAFWRDGSDQVVQFHWKHFQRAAK